MDDILNRLRAGSSQPTQRVSSAPDVPKARSMSQILADLNEKQGALKKQQSDLAGRDGQNIEMSREGSSDSARLTPATDSYDVVSAGGTSQTDTPRPDAAEMLRVKQELAAAKSVITRQEQELAETRNFKHTLDQALGTPSEADFGHRAEVTEQTIGHLQSAFNASARPFSGRADAWASQEDARSDVSDALSAGTYSRARGVWNNNIQPTLLGGHNATGAAVSSFNDFRPLQPTAGAWNPGYQPNIAAHGHGTQNARNFSGPAPAVYGFDQRFANDPHQFQGNRRVTTQFNRPGPPFAGRNAPFAGYGGVQGLPPAGLAPLSYGPVGFQPGNRALSPTASDFTAPDSMASTSGPWGSSVRCLIPLRRLPD